MVPKGRGRGLDRVHGDRQEDVVHRERQEARSNMPGKGATFFLQFLIFRKKDNFLFEARITRL